MLPCKSECARRDIAKGKERGIKLLHAIPQAQASLEGLRNDKERVTIRKEQEEDLERSLLEDRKKAQATACEGVRPTERCCDDRDTFENKIRHDRRMRVTPEPKAGTTIVLWFNDHKMSRKFKKNATFHEVYDWAGAMSVIPLFFTLQRRSKVVLHSHCIEGEEVLDIFERVSTFFCCMLVYLKIEKGTTYSFDLPLLKIFAVSSFCT
ncbi:uncharacterized protein LOC114948467 [Acropora millepora]|uniref:uncharacterized protein LOC114948467 n=1 Tax=Acropora millepora TaxID=45264 RepID=UPI001CF4DC8C|nr:uncharacterized protein LOC114948467 [Acropora millepora]